MWKWWCWWASVDMFFCRFLDVVWMFWEKRWAVMWENHSTRVEGDCRMVDVKYAILEDWLCRLGCFFDLSRKKCQTIPLSLPPTRETALYLLRQMVSTQLAAFDEFSFSPRDAKLPKSQKSKSAPTSCVFFSQQMADMWVIVTSQMSILSCIVRKSLF